MVLSENLYVIITGYFVLSVFTCLCCSTIPAIIVGTTNKKNRVTTIGVALGITVVVSSFIPAANQIMINLLQSQLAPVYIIIFSALISLFVLQGLKTSYFDGKDTL